MDSHTISQIAFAGPLKRWRCEIPGSIRGGAARSPDIDGETWCEHHHSAVSLWSGWWHVSLCAFSFKIKIIRRCSFLLTIYLIFGVGFSRQVRQKIVWFRSLCLEGVLCLWLDFCEAPLDTRIQFHSAGVVFQQKITYVYQISIYTKKYIIRIYILHILQLTYNFSF